MDNLSETNKIGERLITAQASQITQALVALSSALGRPDPPARDIVRFYHDFMDGSWDPFEEVCTIPERASLQAERERRAVRDKILDLIGRDNAFLLDQFCDAERFCSSEMLEHAFLVGYQCAFRFLLLGICPQACQTERPEGAEPGCAEDNNRNSNLMEGTI